MVAVFTVILTKKLLATFSNETEKSLRFILVFGTISVDFYKTLNNGPSCSSSYHNWRSFGSLFLQRKITSNISNMDFNRAFEAKILGSKTVGVDFTRL